jgi:hypothetical protein
MRIAYYADDGTEFETEAECRKYERRLSDLLYELRNGIHAFDDYGKVVNFNADDLYYAFERISYLKFDSQKAIDAFMDKANDFGVPYLENGVKKPLVVGERYYYDYHEDIWHCLEDKQKELNKIAAIFK